jgi:hypothetical protein
MVDTYRTEVHEVLVKLRDGEAVPVNAVRMDRVGSDYYNFQRESEEIDERLALSDLRKRLIVVENEICWLAVTNRRH